MAAGIALGENGGKLGRTGNDGDGVGLPMVGTGVGLLDGVGVGHHIDPNGMLGNDCRGPNQRTPSPISVSVTTMPTRLIRISSALHFTPRRTARQSVRG